MKTALHSDLLSIYTHTGIQSFTKQYASLLLTIDSGICCSFLFHEKLFSQLTNEPQSTMSKCHLGITAHHRVGKCLEKGEALGDTIALTFKELFVS